MNKHYNTALQVFIGICVGVIILFVIFALSGCTQIILEKDRLQINTFLKSVEFDGFYYDPNNGFFEVDKYTGIPSNIELEYDPLTHSFKIKTATNAEK
jgi:hypothetical protein